MSNILDRLNSEAVAWKPEPGQLVYGEVIDTAERVSDYGPYPLVVLRSAQDNQDYAVHAFHSVLKNELSKLAPAIGDTLGIKYLGKAKNKAGSEYENYKVVVERKNGTSGPDWAAHKEEAQQELAATEEPF